MATAADVPKQRSRFKRILITSLKVSLYTFVIAAIALAIAVSVAVSQLPSFQEMVRRDDLGQTIRVRAANGEIIHTMGPVFGQWIPYDRIPPVMREAIIAVEDRRFRSHPGVDPIGIVRGIFVSASGGDRVRGVSTITQQLARNIFLSSERSFARKLREGILALALEWQFSKEQILELYLNRVYFGGGAYGIDAAARRFFGHSATQLSVEEAAIIAGLVKAPSNYAPTADMAAARDRGRVALGLMVENGAITQAQADAADIDAIRPARITQRQDSNRYFIDWVLPQLNTLIDESQAPLDVWTTIDPVMQRTAHAAINANTPRGAQGAMVTLDRDGAVRTMVGGRDYVGSSYNRATQANRQAGSSFKLFVYLTALEAGYRPETTVADEPITIGGWSPRNSNGRFMGPIPVRIAFAYSVNTVAVRLAQQVGTRAVADMAQRFGITTRIETNPSMALGSNSVRLIDMTRAYASVARGGVGVTPYGIRRVTTADGTLLYQQPVNEARVLVAPWVAAQMTELLQGVVEHGTGRGAALGRPTAGKTGTTSSNKDGWFIGFSSGLTTGVWMGRDDNRALPGLSGGQAPARAFHALMVRAVANRPVEQFQTDATGPEWEIEGGDNALLEIAPPDDEPFVDADGNPVERDGPPADDFRPNEGLPPEEEDFRAPYDEELDVRTSEDALIGA